MPRNFPAPCYIRADELEIPFIAVNANRGARERRPLARVRESRWIVGRGLPHGLSYARQPNSLFAQEDGGEACFFAQKTK